MANGDPRGYDAIVNAMTGNYGPGFGPPPPPTPAPGANAPNSNAAPVSAVVPTVAPLPGLNVPTTVFSPQALQSQAEMGQEMQKAAMDTSAIRSWTQGMARVANALVGG